MTILANSMGNRTTPSWVAWTDAERLVGEAAKNQAVRAVSVLRGCARVCACVNAFLSLLKSCFRALSLCVLYFSGSARVCAVSLSLFPSTLFPSSSFIMLSFQSLLLHILLLNLFSDAESTEHRV